jgi:antitoxin component of MazEF toxin-antitoxin module
MTLDTNTTRVGESIYILIPDFIVNNFNLNKEGNDDVEFSISDDKVIFIVKKQEKK